MSFINERINKGLQSVKQFVGMFVAEWEVLPYLSKLPFEKESPTFCFFK